MMKLVAEKRCEKLDAVLLFATLFAIASSSACKTEGDETPMMTAGSFAMSGAGSTASGAGTTASGGSMAGNPMTAGSNASMAGTTSTMTAGSSGSTSAAGSDSSAGMGGTTEPSAGMGGEGAAGTMAEEPEVQTCPATSELEPGETTESIDVGGTTRRYILHVPDSYDGSKPMPLVVDWHPLLTDMAFERANSGYAALGDREGFITAFPDGIDNAWNVGVCCTFSRDVDDLGFARALVDSLKSRGCIDNKRVYSVGFSMGAGMTIHLACNAADVFAAFAPAAFELLEEDEWPCNPSRPVSILQTHGTADFIVPYSGGASTPPNGLGVTIHFLGAEGTFEKFAMLSGCTGSPTMAANGCNTYTQCNEGAEVGLCTIQGGGHSTGDAERGWEFMKRHSLP